MSDEDDRKALAKEVVTELFRHINEYVGKSVLKKMFWGLLLGAVVIGVAVGWIKIPIH